MGLLEVLYCGLKLAPQLPARDPRCIEPLSLSLEVGNFAGAGGELLLEERCEHGFALAGLALDLCEGRIQLFQKLLRLARHGEQRYLPLAMIGNLVELLTMGCLRRSGSILLLQVLEYLELGCRNIVGMIDGLRREVLHRAQGTLEFLDVFSQIVDLCLEARRMTVAPIVILLQQINLLGDGGILFHQASNFAGLFTQLPLVLSLHVGKRLVSCGLRFFKVGLKCLNVRVHRRQNSMNVVKGRRVLMMPMSTTCANAFNSSVAELRCLPQVSAGEHGLSHDSAAEEAADKSTDVEQYRGWSPHSYEV
mmetsp:Transcript_51030/g.110720  ORF Transcript_51030/g.110720 Transcript_51030/m.110720 type:complete len:307 (+) Transcript_51030:1402-2322(+)